MNAPSHKPIPCFECDGTLERVLRPQKTQLPDLGPVTVPDVPVLTCPKCGDTVLGDEGTRYMDAWLNQYTDALTPEELKQFLDQYGLTHKQAAVITGYGEKNICRWVSGRMRPSVSVSNFFRVLIANRSAFETLKCRQWTGTPAMRCPSEERQPDAQEKVILKQIDYATLVQLQVVASKAGPKDRRTELCRVFELTDLRCFVKKADDHLLGMAAFKDTKQKSNKISGAIWMELGCRAARQLQVKPYDRDKLREAVSQLRELTRTPLMDVIPQVRQILAEAGVALVFAPIMKHSAFRGCTRLLTPTKAVIIHSMKYRSLAQFWLILFHEIAHLLLHINGVEDVYAEYEDQKQDPREKQADEWAEDTLVYSDRLIAFRARHEKPDPAQVEQFAREVKVHPAIAAEVFNRKAEAEVISYAQLRVNGLFPGISAEEAAYLWKNNPFQMSM